MLFLKSDNMNIIKKKKEQKLWVYEMKNTRRILWSLINFILCYKNSAIIVYTQHQWLVYIIKVICLFITSLNTLANKITIEQKVFIL